MTAHDRRALTLRWSDAKYRERRAIEQGDRLGALVAAGDARRIMARLTAEETTR